MAQLFSPRADTLLRTILIAGAAIVLFLPMAVWAFARTPAATGQYRAYRQPIPFAHTLHVNGLRIDCRYCHAGAERAAMAGLPPTTACVPCHIKGLVASNLFTPVRESLSSGRPIPWRRVTTLADFVFFSHAVHVRTGVECDTCHGPVQLMQDVYQAAPLTMEWCVACHRAPEEYLRTRETQVDGWRKTSPERGRLVAAQYNVQRLTSCTSCHR